MATDLDLIRKLIKLALHNPNEAEAHAAALKACELLEDAPVLAEGKSIPLNKTYKPDPEFDATVEELFKRAKDSMKSTNPDEFKPERMAPDTDIDDDFMRQRIKKAWQRIRDERANLNAEIHHYEVRTHMKFRRLEDL